MTDIKEVALPELPEPDHSYNSGKFSPLWGREKMHAYAKEYGALCYEAGQKAFYMPSTSDDLPMRLRTHDDPRLYHEADLLLCEASQEIVRLRDELAALRAQPQAQDTGVREAHFEEQPDGTIIPIDPDEMGAPEFLLPCPFCGSSDLGDPNFECDYGIQCNTCGAMHGHENREEAIRLWNTRAALKQSLAQPAQERCPEHGNTPITVDCLACLTENLLPEILEVHREGQQPAQAAVPEGWQPIESAPKNGNEIIVFHPIAGVCAAFCPGDDFAWHCMDGQNTVIGAKSKTSIPRMTSFIKPPTHWMPLPIPPGMLKAAPESREG